MEEARIKEEENVPANSNTAILEELKKSQELLRKNMEDQSKVNSYTAETITDLKKQLSATRGAEEEDYSEEMEEKGKFKKYLKEIQGELKQERQENILKILPAELPDFKEVYSDSNISEVSKKDPAFRKALDALWDAGDKERAVKLMYDRIKDTKKASQTEDVKAKEQQFEMAGGVGYNMSNQGTPSNQYNPANVFRHTRPDPARDFFTADSDFINPSPERKRKAYAAIYKLANAMN